LYAVAVAIVLGATSLYRELELKTIFPILARPLRRGEYLVGKLAGTVLTLFVFVAANSGALLVALALLAGSSLELVAALLVLLFAVTALLAWRVPRSRTYLPALLAVSLCVAGFVLSSGAPDDRRVLAGSAVLTLCEVVVVASIATLFSSFSSPFLTAIFTLSLFVVGRSADSLAKLPKRVFGETIHSAGVWLGKVVPNLMLYVPPRPLLTGEAAGSDLAQYLLLAFAHAAAWSVVLIAVASAVFKRRDFL
jgi:ABC-type transport system involved in multi-copper enzyme maturation permease subunit